MTLQTDLERILALAQAEVVCPDCRGTKRVSSMTEIGVPGGSFGCGRCQETGKVPDPRYKGLVEVLTMPCPCGPTGACQACWKGDAASSGWCFEHDDDCLFCRGIGRVLRSWEDQPQGALGGVILCHVEAAAGEALLSGDGNIYYPLRDLGAAIARTFQGPDCDSLIVKLVLEYLERTKEATHATE